MMVSRLILSLKKSADAQSVAEWRVDHFTRIEPMDAPNAGLEMRPTNQPMGEPASSQSRC